MRIALTGGSGLVGQCFAGMYADKYDITVLGRDNTDYSEASLGTVLKDIDAVVHLAGVRINSLPVAERLKMGSYRPNIEIVDVLLHQCKEYGINNVVMASSLGVYGGTNTLPWSEDEEAVPGNFYGISKLTAEKIGELYSNKFGLRVKSLRIGQVLSADEKKGFLLRTLFDNAMEGKPQTIYGTGAGLREYVYIKDVARAIDAALSCPEVSGVFNVGTGMAMSALELAEMINEVFENRAETIFLKDKPEDLSSSLMNVEKAARVLGYRAKYTVEEAVADIRYYKIK